jgi:AcrR family transcriptional regulator
MNYNGCMARSRSDEKRSAILKAATAEIVAKGLGASTASIAKRAGVANGSFFTYFETKADLLNQLFLELKAEMASTTMKDVPEDAGMREQAHQVWRNWMSFATTFPEKRRAIALLAVSDEITPATRAAGQKPMAGFLAVMERVRANGPLRSAPKSFAAAIMSSLGDATMEAMLQDPAGAEAHCEVGFEAFWRTIT